MCPHILLITFVSDLLRYISIVLSLYVFLFYRRAFWSKCASKTNNYTKWNLITKIFVIVSDGEFTCKTLHFWGWNFKSVLLLFGHEIRSKLKFVGRMNLDLSLSSDQVFL